MTRKDQRTLIINFMNSIRDEIVSKIDNGTVPEEWDGHELREYVYDKVSYERTNVMRERGRNRKRVHAYMNELYTRNL